MLDSAHNVHFVGIGGIGMSALALLLKQQGKVISGSDQMDSALLDTLRNAGIRVQLGHTAKNAQDADLLVFSSAVKPDNPERLYAEQHGIPEIRRAELLGEIAMVYQKTIAVAGTHGKTTTTGLCGQILVQAGLDPGILVGGILPDLNSNLRLGGQNYLVIEADEYDRSLLALQPDAIIVTTLEVDHLDIYEGIQDLRDTFFEFISKLKQDATLVIQGDDDELVSLAERSTVPATSYGLSEQVDYRATELRMNSFTSHFKVVKQGFTLGEIILNMPGRHNVMNALGACALTHRMGVEFDSIKAGLESFQGVERRFQKKALINGTLFIDDYAHHPSEVSAALEAARSGWPSARIIAVFQPHLYSRTRDFALEFAQALQLADLAIVTDIYPARELPIPGVSSDLIVTSAENILLKPSLEEVYAFVSPILRSGDLLITLGAGDVWKLHELFMGETD